MKDDPRPTVRKPSDLVSAIACLVGIAGVCLMVLYAHNTTEGMAADVRAFNVLVQRILFVPVAVLDLVVILFPPIAVGIDLLIRRYPLVALQGLIAAVGGIIAGVAAIFLIHELGPSALVTGLSVLRSGEALLTIPSYVCAITALLTAVATPARRRTITWSWNLMWISVVVAVATMAASLPGMAIALLIGRCVGYVVRYGLGVASHRAYGPSLVDGVRRAGFHPVSIDRVSPVPVAETAGNTPGVQTPQFFSDHRLYVMRTVTGKLYNVIVLDGDRQLLGTLSRLWQYLRSRAIEGGRTTLSLRQTAERTALLSYAVRSAGVTTPAVLSVAEAEDSMLIVREATASSVSFADLDPDEVSDELLDSMWYQIRQAHRCGVVHRSLTPQCFRVGLGPDGLEVTVLGWETGDLASSELPRRVDLTQMMAVTATKVGPDRAVAAANRALDSTELLSVAPLLQVPAVPKLTRDKMSDAKQVLADLRAELTRDVPDLPSQSEQITRVGVRTILMAVLVAVAVVVVLTSFNLREVVDALRGSDWRWGIAAFGIGLFGFTGAAMSLMAFSPVKLSFWKVFVCQIAACFVAVAAPAGFGPAAVNLRLLVKRGVSGAIATATVALNQVTNIAIVALSMIVLTVVSGSSQLLRFQVTPGMLVAIMVVAVVVAAVMLVPRTRGWVQARVTPMLQQTWPRLVQLFSSPHRLVLGILGNLILVLSYMVAFQWAVYAFGQSLPFIATALVYLVGTTAGSAIPTPGGMGTIEVTESATMASMGVNPGVAASIVMLFRVVTFWIRIPLGWVAYRLMQRADVL